MRLFQKNFQRNVKHSIQMEPKGRDSRKQIVIFKKIAVAQSKIRRLVNCYCNDLDVKLVFTMFKLRNLFSVKDSVPRELCSPV